MAKSAQERRDDNIKAATKAVEVAEKRAKASGEKLAKAEKAVADAREKAAPLAEAVALAKANLEWAKSQPVSVPVVEDVDTFDQADELEDSVAL